MHSLDQLLSRVVERKGFTVQGADQEALFARKGDQLLLAAWKLDGPLSAADAQIFLTALDQVHATTAILVATQGVDPAATELINAKGVEVWAESRLVVEVGEALVKDACEGATHPAAAPSVPAALPATPAPAALPAARAGEYNAFRASAEVQAANRPSSKFPSLVAQAASASTVSNHGAAQYLPSKPRQTAPEAQAARSSATLGYAWSGAAAGGSAFQAGIAQVRNGRNPKNRAQAAPAAPAAAPSPIIVPNDDVEIISTPRRGASPAAPQQPAPTRAPPAPVPAETDAYEIITTKKPKGAEVVASATPAVGASGCLKLNVTKEEALVAANAKPGSTARLALVPHVAFTYDVCIERPNLPGPITGKGALVISSQTGELRAIDALAWADAAPAGARKDAEKLQAVDIYDKVKGHMSKTFGRTMNVERELAGNTVMQNVKISPEPEEMGLQHLGMISVPVWEVTTMTGVVKIDAFSGATIQ